MYKQCVDSRRYKNHSVSSGFSKMSACNDVLLLFKLAEKGNTKIKIKQLAYDLIISMSYLFINNFKFFNLSSSQQASTLHLPVLTYIPLTL